MIIGIDLGTTNSLVTHFHEDGPKLIENAVGSPLTPSVVFSDPKGSMVIGAAAKNRLMTAPERTVAKFKRLMGTNQQTKLGKKNFRPEDLSALVLRALKEDAEAKLEMKITDAVISVPAYFNDVQRKATIAAAEIAGMNVKRLINEPTAAALAYGLQDKEGESTFLIVDLGGGTFDVSILEMFSGVMEVRSSSGDAFLGGEDFTDRVTDEFLKQLDLDANKLSADDLARLRVVADKAKCHLSELPETDVTFTYEDKEHVLTLNRRQFEEMSTDLLNRMKLPLQRAISDASLKADQIDRIVLVGGATRMPVVRNLITRLFKRFPEHELDPDTVVALGVAVQAGLISRDAALEEIVMTDVCPFTLGFESSREVYGTKQREHGIFNPLIERNTTVPVSRKETIHPMDLGQRQLSIIVYQGEAPYVRDNIKIGEYLINIPYNTKEYEAVDLRYTYDNSGTLEVISTVVSTKKETKLIIEGNPGALTKKEIVERFKELEKIKIHPREEAENDQLLSRLTAAYANSLGQKREEISAMLSRFEGALSTYDKRQIELARTEIAEQIDYFEENDVF